MKKLFLLFFLLFIKTATAHYPCIIFDCDGVLVDTERLKFEAWQEALNEKGISFTLEEYLPLVGHSSEYIAKALECSKGSLGDLPSFISHKDSLYHKRQKQGVPLLKDGIQFLKKVLKEKPRKHFKIAVVSSATRPEIYENLKQIGLSPEAFDAVLSGKDDLDHIKDPEGTNKPKPYIYQLAAQKLFVLPKECIVFEDTSAGVVAAADAGMDVIAVPNEFTKGHDFSKARQVTSFKGNNLLEYLFRAAPSQ